MTTKKGKGKVASALDALDDLISDVKVEEESASAADARRMDVAERAADTPVDPDDAALVPVYCDLARDFLWAGQTHHVEAHSLGLIPKPVAPLGPNTRSARRLLGNHRDALPRDQRVKINYALVTEADDDKNTPRG